MGINTCAGVISLAKELENGSATYYKDLMDRLGKGKDVFIDFMKENEKNVVQVERAYYGVISDALEGCFAFDIHPEEYALKTEIGKEISSPEALRTAGAMEEKILNFYVKAAEQSKYLLADVSRAFLLVAKRRGMRLSRLRSLIT